MKIVFVFAPVPVKFNHGIALLSALCKQRGIDVGLYVIGGGGDFDKSIEDADFVGFSCVCLDDYEACIPYAGRAQEAGKVTLIGGPHMRKHEPVHQNFNKVCRGDGEQLPDFILRSGKTPFVHEGRVYTGSLDDLPLPDYNLFDGLRFDRGIPYFHGNALPYFSSRGCPSGCPFCFTARYSKPLRIRRRVYDDLSYLIPRHRPDAIFMGDACAPYYDAGWRDSWDGFRFPFFAYIRADIHPKDLRFMIDHGMVGCAFGVEAGDENYRNVVLGKSLSNAALFRTVGTLREAGVDYSPFFMQDTPEEGVAQRNATNQMRTYLGGYPVTFRYERLGV